MARRLAFILTIALLLAQSGASADAGGFDQYGYNRGARIFVGLADGVDRSLDGTVWGDAKYANDHLVMKWNAEWDRGNAEGWSDPNGYDAWLNNEWNGRCGGCSGETWAYKIVWVGSCAAVPAGAYCVWGQFAVIHSQGTIGGAHIWDARAKPAGFGAYR